MTVHTVTELPVGRGTGTSASYPASRGWERRVRARVALVDAIAVYLAVLAAFAIRYGAKEVADPDPRTTVSRFATTALVLMVIWLGVLWFSNSLDITLMGAGTQEYARVTNTTMAVFGAAAIAAYLLEWPLGRAFAAIALPMGLILLNLGRYLMRRRLVAERRAGENLSRALVVGSKAGAAHLIDELRRTPQAGIKIVAACITSGSPARRRGGAPSIGGIPVVAEVRDAASYLAAHPTEIDTVVVTGCDEITPKVLKRLAWDLEPTGAGLVLAPGLTDVAGPRIHTRPVPGMALVHVEPPGYTVPQLRLKRVFDVAVSAVLIALFSVPLIVTAIAIKLTSKGPVLFRQTRIGVNGTPFQVLKFRSMVANAEARLQEVVGEDVAVFYKAKTDPRVTPIGKFIRRFSIDELPQLFNVLGGSMSLVGPRPQVPLEVEQYDRDMGRRLLIKPGMTGLWQVSGRNNLDLQQSVRLDLYYVENWSMIEDLMILMRTVKAVIGSDGAY